MNPPWRYLQVPTADWQPDGAPLSLEARVLLALVWDLARRNGGPDADVGLGMHEASAVTGASRSALQRACADLVSRGLLVLVSRGSRRKGHTSTYRLGGKAHRGPKRASPRGPVKPTVGLRPEVLRPRVGSHRPRVGTSLEEREPARAAHAAAPFAE